MWCFWLRQSEGLTSDVYMCVVCGKLTWQPCHTAVDGCLEMRAVKMREGKVLRNQTNKRLPSTIWEANASKNDQVSLGMNKHTPTAATQANNKRRQPWTFAVKRNCTLFNRLSCLVLKRFTYRLRLSPLAIKLIHDRLLCGSTSRA